MEKQYETLNPKCIFGTSDTSEEKNGYYSFLQYTKWILPLYPSDNFLSGFQVLASGLRNLEELYLNDNKLNDNILPSLSGFSSLKSLDLSENMFTGSTGLNGKVVNHSYLKITFPSKV
jgi:Leucine-rich repeat (LRR) protein